MASYSEPQARKKVLEPEAKGSYYGLAGLFSTDDSGADATQIETERGPWDEEEEWDEDPYEEFVDNLPTEEILYAGCPECPWWDSAPYWGFADLERTKEYLRAQHREERPGCGGELEFD